MPRRPTRPVTSCTASSASSARLAQGNGVARRPISPSTVAPASPRFGYEFVTAVRSLGASIEIGGAHRDPHGGRRRSGVERLHQGGRHVRARRRARDRGHPARLERARIGRSRRSGNAGRQFRTARPGGSAHRRPVRRYVPAHVAYESGPGERVRDSGVPRRPSVRRQPRRRDRSRPPRPRAARGSTC